MLSERQRLILNAIINDYIFTAEPVGSRSISKHKNIGFSPATIRNEMSDLEEKGFLEQPHTSAGRIPSHKGYRYFVDHLIQPEDLSNQELEVLKLFLKEKIFKTEEVMQQVASILSNLTKYTSIALGSDMLNTSLKHLQLIPINKHTAVAIIVTDTGHVENRSVSIPPEVEMSDIEKFVNLLNMKLAGTPLFSLRSKLYNEISSELKKHVDEYEKLVYMLETALTEGNDERLYLSGATNMLIQPEFRDFDKIKTIFDLFDKTDSLTRLVTTANTGIEVRIGSENQLDAMQNCSFITANYSFQGQWLGTVGILGPTRMDYGKVIHMLEHVSVDLIAHFSRQFKS